ncbi:MAG: transketolase, partial [Candidatus Omnitrophota bacterium]
MVNEALEIKELRERSRQVRRTVIQMLSTAGSGHPGGSLSSADLVTALYFSVLKH